MTMPDATKKELQLMQEALGEQFLCINRDIGVFEVEGVKNGRIRRIKTTNK